MDTQLLGGEEEGVAMPPINDKYEMNLEMDDHLDSLEAFLFDNDLRKYAKTVQHTHPRPKQRPQSP